MSGDEVSRQELTNLLQARNINDEHIRESLHYIRGELANITIMKGDIEGIKKDVGRLIDSRKSLELLISANAKTIGSNATDISNLKNNNAWAYKIFGFIQAGFLIFAAYWLNKKP